MSDRTLPVPTVYLAVDMCIVVTECIINNCDKLVKEECYSVNEVGIPCNERQCAIDYFCTLVSGQTPTRWLEKSARLFLAWKPYDCVLSRHKS